MRVAIPHDLDPAVVRERLKGRSHEIAGHVPGGMAQVGSSWPSEDPMQMEISAMGQRLVGNISILPSEVVIEMDLPGMLAFMEPMISSTIRTQAQKVLTKG